MSRRIAQNRLSNSLEGGSRRHKPDYILVLLATILCGIGLILLVAISPALAAQNDVSGSFYVARQLVALLIGAVLFVILSKLDIRKLAALSTPLMMLSAVAVLAVLAISGVAFRWIQIGGMSFQPAELIKFTIIVSASSFLAQKISVGEVGDVRKTLYPIAIAMGLAIFSVMILERDLGSTMVMAAIILTILILSNVPLGKVLVAVLALAVLGGLAIASTSYRRDRFMTFMNPERDCATTGYHVCQALIAVGSGGVIGLGVGNSVQAYGYLPEAANDSIFAIFAEKFGFVGSVVLLAVYGMLLSRILMIVRRAPDPQSRLIAGGVFAWLGAQASINMGAMMALIPLKGITLPFISYGGTSLMFVLGALGLVFNISTHTVVRRSLNTRKGDGDEDHRSVGRRDSRPRYTTYRSSN